MEFVDLYPSLSELARLPLPEHLEGTSFRPLLANPELPWKTAVFSRWIAGDSIKTDTHLYTEWRNRNGAITARMLFDHRSDPAEDRNLSLRPDNRAVMESLSRELGAGWRAAVPPASATASGLMR